MAVAVKGRAEETRRLATALDLDASVGLEHNKTTRRSPARRFSNLIGSNLAI